MKKKIIIKLDIEEETFYTMIFKFSQNIPPKEANDHIRIFPLNWRLIPLYEILTQISLSFPYLTNSLSRVTFTNPTGHSVSLRDSNKCDKEDLVNNEQEYK